MTSPDSPSILISHLGEGLAETLEIDQTAHVSILNPWHRSGAETYASDFTVQSDQGTVHMLAKACVAFSPTETMNDWLKRRAYLQENGANVPILYGVGKAVLIEEFIPYSFRERIADISADKLDSMRDSLQSTCELILNLGFNVLSLHDLRSRDSDAVIVDFGSDLGSPNPTPSKEQSIDKRVRQLTTSILRRI